MPENNSPPPNAFERATVKADTIGIWAGIVGLLYTFSSSLWEGRGMAVSALLGLAAFPLAFLTAILIRSRRDLADNIVSFLRSHATAPPSSAAPHEVLGRVEALETRLRDFGQRSTGLYDLEELRRKMTALQSVLGATDDRTQAVHRAVRTLVLAQIMASRALMVGGFWRTIPRRPDGGESGDLDAVEKFSQHAASYVAEAEQLTRAWGLVEWDRFEFHVKRLEREAEDAFERGTHPGDLDARKFSALRRYHIASVQLDWVGKYLRSEIRRARDEEARLLMDLREHYAELDSAPLGRSMPPSGSA